MSNSCRAAGRSLRTGWTKPIAKIKNGDTQRFTKLQPATRLLISLRATEFPQRTFLQTGTGSYPSFGGELSFKYGTYKRDRKSTRLNSSHGYISYAVFCLKKKNNRTQSNKREST